MKKHLRHSLTWLVCGMLSLGITSGYAGAEDLKIGFVNPVQILETAPQVEEANKRLEGEFAPREQDIIEMQQEIKDLEEKIEKDAEIMSDAQLNKTRKSVLAKRRDLKRKQDEFREDYNIRRSEELNKLQKRIYKAIESLAKEENYDLIVSEGVIVASKRVDITEKVLRRLNQER